MNDGALHEFLRPTTYVDSDADTVVAFARRVTDGVADPVARAVALYYAVRDEITYTAYCDFKSVETYRASGCLARGAGFCVGKAALLAAAARAADIPARVGFADVRNHLTSPRLRRLMTTDVFYYHGYAELYLDGAWVKATAVFDKTLCDRVGIRPLEFDGRHDALFHPFDASGRQHMEYVRDRGASADVPVVEIIEAFDALLSRPHRGGRRRSRRSLPQRGRARAGGAVIRRARRARCADARELIDGRRRPRRRQCSGAPRSPRVTIASKQWPYGWSSPTCSRYQARECPRAQNSSTHRPASTSRLSFATT